MIKLVFVPHEIARGLEFFGSTSRSPGSRY